MTTPSSILLQNAKSLTTLTIPKRRAVVTVTSGTDEPVQIQSDVKSVSDEVGKSLTTPTTLNRTASVMVTNDTDEPVQIQSESPTTETTASGSIAEDGGKVVYHSGLLMNVLTEPQSDLSELEPEVPVTEQGKTLRKRKTTGRGGGGKKTRLS